MTSTFTFFRIYVNVDKSHRSLLRCFCSKMEPRSTFSIRISGTSRQIRESLRSSQKVKQKTRNAWGVSRDSLRGLALEVSRDFWFFLWFFAGLLWYLSIHRDYAEIPVKKVDLGSNDRERFLYRFIWCLFFTGLWMLIAHLISQPCH
jgi:hypothetical protein